VVSDLAVALAVGGDCLADIATLREAPEAAVPMLTGRIEKMARQLSKRSNKIVTLQNLRQMVVDIAKGISGIQYGAKPVPLGDQNIDELREVAIAWTAAFFDAFAAETTDRDKHLASTGPSSPPSAPWAASCSASNPTSARPACAS